jgi:molecular chaperone DnaJ
MTHYQMLGVSTDATPADIKAAYRRRVIETHPDNPAGTRDAGQFKRVRLAYLVLSNPAEREQYDMRLGLGAYGRSEGGPRHFDRAVGGLFEGLHAAVQLTQQIARDLDHDARRVG